VKVSAESKPLEPKFYTIPALNFSLTKKEGEEVRAFLNKVAAESIIR